MNQVVRGIAAFVIVAGVAMSFASARAGAQAGGGRPGAARACAVLNKEEIKQIAGAHTPRYFDQIPPEETALSAGGSTCAFGGFMVQLDAVPVSAFESTRKAYEARAQYEHITDVADEAYFYEQGPPGRPAVVGVYARAGQRVFVVSMNVGAEETAAVLRPIVVALARAGATRLR